MERIRAGKEEIRLNCSTSYFSKLPGKVFRELRLLYFQVLNSVKLLRDYIKGKAFLFSQTPGLLC